MSGQIRVLPSWDLSFSQACEEEIRDCVAKEITLIPSSFVARVGKICASVELDYEQLESGENLPQCFLAVSGSVQPNIGVVLDWRLR
jgi:hypothetical protein